MNIRKGFNFGHVLGIIFVFMLILIIIGFVKLTWNFWEGILIMMDWWPEKP